MPSFESNKATLFYEFAGTGRPLVFTHGASWDRRQWDKQVDYFKDRYQVITWDVRGHGDSTLPEGPVNPEDFSKDLIALLDHLEIDKAILCGLSMGGHISLQTAIRYPERVEGLVLIGTPCTNSFNLYEKLVVPINRFSIKLIPMKTTAKLLAKTLSKFNPDNAQYILETVSKIPHNNFNRLWHAITGMESKDDLHKVKAPTLILVGDHDNLTSRQQKYIQQNIADSELKIIKNAHHSTNLDNPKDVNQAIAEFLEKILSN